MAKKSVSKNKSRSKSSSRKRTKRRVSYKKRKLNKPQKKTRKKSRTKRVMKGGVIMCVDCQEYPSQINGINTSGHMRKKYNYTYSHYCKNCDTNIYFFIKRDSHTALSEPKGKFKETTQGYLLSRYEFTNGDTKGQGDIPLYYPFVRFTLSKNNYIVVKGLIDFSDETSTTPYSMSLLSIKKKNIKKADLDNIPFQDKLNIPV